MWLFQFCNVKIFPQWKFTPHNDKVDRKDVLGGQKFEGAVQNFRKEDSIFVKLGYVKYRHTLLSHLHLILLTSRNLKFVRLLWHRVDI